MRLKSHTNLLKCLPAIVFLALISGCTLSGGGNASFDSVKGEKIVQTARTVIGTPYCWGGTSPSQGFDCSGYVFWVYKQHGYNLPRTAAEQARAGASVSKGNLRAGDIVVFNPSWGKHTGIYTGRKTFLHSPKSGSRVKEESLNTPYWSRIFAGGRRIIR